MNWIQAVVVTVAITAATTGLAAPSTFSYQGQLQKDGRPFDGVCNFTFSLWDELGTGDPPQGGNQIGPAVALSNHPLNNGLFTVPLDFGSEAFNGNANRYLQISIKCPAAGGTQTTLAPRQTVQASPHSISTRGIDVASSGDVSISANVGIGTAIPATRVDIKVQGTQSGLTPALRLGQSTAGASSQDVLSGTEMEFFGNDRIFAKLSGGTRGLTTGREGFLSFATRDASSAEGVLAERMRISGTGNVGIGTTTPNAALDVRAIGDGTALLRLSSERAWEFRQRGAGSGAHLELRDITGGKNFRVAGLDGDAVAIFKTAFGDLGSQRVILAPTAGRVGIGTESPQAKVHIADTGNAYLRLDSGPGLLSEINHFNAGVAGSAIKLFPASDSRGIGFYTGGEFSNNSPKVMIKTSGRVGIGTTSPSAKLEISGGAEGIRINPQSGGTAGISIQLAGDTTSDQTSFTVGRPGDTDSMGFVFNNGSQDSMKFLTASRTRMTVLANGNVGIGTVSPTAKLDVKATGDGAPVLKLRTDRPWVFEQVGIGGNTSLRLRSTVPGAGKDLIIETQGDVRIGTDAAPGRLRVNGPTVTEVITITGADLAEKFKVTEVVQPGMVVQMDPHTPEHFMIARGEYNTLVSGIVSGANGLPAGAILGNLPGYEDAIPIALAGRVWTWCDADESGAIQMGDMLTTSDTPGHAMKATDRDLAFGSIIGKAMTSLDSGRGLVLVLVSIQ
jgi:hypothetical protein